MIISPGTEVTFYEPDLRGVEIGGERAPLVRQRSDSIAVRVKEGTRPVRLWKRVTGT